MKTIKEDSSQHYTVIFLNLMKSLSYAYTQENNIKGGLFKIEN